MNAKLRNIALGLTCICALNSQQAQAMSLKGNSSFVMDCFDKDFITRIIMAADHPIANYSSWTSDRTRQVANEEPKQVIKVTKKKFWIQLDDQSTQGFRALGSINRKTKKVKLVHQWYQGNRWKTDRTWKMNCTFQPFSR